MSFCYIYKMHDKNDIIHYWCNSRKNSVDDDTTFYWMDGIFASWKNVHTEKEINLSLNIFIRILNVFVKCFWIVCVASAWIVD